MKGATTSANTYVSITTPAFSGGGTKNLDTHQGCTTLGDGGKKFHRDSNAGNNWGDDLRRGRVPSRALERARAGFLDVSSSRVANAGFLDVASFERRRSTASAGPRARTTPT